MNDLYATIIFDYPRDGTFPGCNSVMRDAIEKLDREMIEVRAADFKFKPGKIRLSFDIYTKFDDIEKPITDETEAEEFLLCKLEKLELPKAVILIDTANSELLDGSELDRAALSERTWKNAFGRR